MHGMKQFTSPANVLQPNLAYLRASHVATDTAAGHRLSSVVFNIVTEPPRDIVLATPWYRGQQSRPETGEPFDPDVRAFVHDTEADTERIRLRGIFPNKIYVGFTEQGAQDREQLTLQLGADIGQLCLSHLPDTVHGIVLLDGRVLER